MKNTNQNQLQKATAAFLKENQGDELVKKAGPFLSELFNVDNVIIGHLLEGGLRIRTLSFYSHGKDLGVLEYNLEHTPCENIVNRKACFYPRNIIHLFPNDQELKDLKAESYLGTPIFNKAGESVGLLALIHSNNMYDADEMLEVLKEVSAALSPVIENHSKLNIAS